jgi:glycosyltransferase involved in cell wall biosynthesis
MASNGCADYYGDTYGVPADVIAYGADTTLSPPGETLRKFALRPREYVLYVSRLEPENNADKVIQAYRSVKSDFPLMIVGDAPYSTRFKEQLKALAAQDSRVIMAGAIYGPGYRELISNACIYVQATEVGGTHPALIEAMATANCVVANDVKEHAEVLGGRGVLYAKNDVGDLAAKIQDLLQDDRRRAEYARAAREHAIEHYSWQRVTDAYEALFFDLHERRRSPHAELTESRALDRE